jgi:hypothetical protein
VDRSVPGERRFFRNGDPLPEELFEPMLRAALRISYLSGSATRSFTFIQSLSVCFGYRRCAEFLIAYCDAADIADADGIINVALALQPNRWITDPRHPPESNPGSLRILVCDFEGEGVADVRSDLVDALLRGYLRWDDASVRSGLEWILGLKSVESQKNRERLLQIAASIGVDSADPRIAHIFNPS